MGYAVMLGMQWQGFCFGGKCFIVVISPVMIRRRASFSLD